MGRIGLAGAPYVTVSPLGLANGQSNLPNNGTDFGPDTPGSVTTGIQEALKRGGTVRLLAGSVAFMVNSDLYLPADGITVIADSGVTIQSNNNGSIHIVNDSTGTPHTWIRLVGNVAKSFESSAGSFASYHGLRVACTSLRPSARTE